MEPLHPQTNDIVKCNPGVIYHFINNMYLGGTYYQNKNFKGNTMRLEDLAVRLVAVEAKVASLAGYGANPDLAKSLEELDARLGLLECTVEILVTAKTQEHIDAIVAAPAATTDGTPAVLVDAVVALSASADHAEAADIVADVITAQVEAEPVAHEEVADIVAAAVQAIVTASPEVVVDPIAITAAVVQAVTDAPAPAPEVAQAAADAVVEVIATVTGVDTVAPEIVQQVADAVAVPADPALNAIETRLDIAEAKIDSLLGK